MKVDASNPSPDKWEDIIPETEMVLTASTAGEKIFAFYLEDAKTKVVQFDRKGAKERDIELPGIGTAGGFHGKDEDTEVYYTFTSFTEPSTIFKYNLEIGKSELYQRQAVDFVSDHFRQPGY